jgi:hypothetical protein
MKKFLYSLFGIIIVLTIAAILNLWIGSEKATAHLNLWAAFVSFLIVGHYFVEFGSKEERVQKFLSFCSLITAGMFLAFSVSFLNVFAETWLGTVRWSLVIISLILYIMLVFEISEKPMNMKRRALKQMEWRYLVNNHLLTAAVLIIFTQRMLVALKIDDPLANYSVTGFIIWMTILHIVWRIITEKNQTETKIPNP